MPSPDEIAAIEVELALNVRARVLQETEQRSPRGSSSASLPIWCAAAVWSNRVGMVMVGTLIAESLRVGAVIEGIRLVTTKFARADVGDVSASQPLTWTFIEFEVAEDDAERLALALEHSLQRPGGWYCDFRSNDETFVVFAERTFRYPRGDRAGRAEATQFGRAVGVPEAQLDWPI
jgi:hypothetical protein